MSKHQLAHKDPSLRSSVTHVHNSAICLQVLAQRFLKPFIYRLSLQELG